MKIEEKKKRKGKKKDCWHQTGDPLTTRATEK
jgi:hypothetical protein